METREFHPLLIPRTGERNAWLLAGVALFAWVILALRLPRAPIWIPLMAVIFTLSAASISLGNWVDRKTALTLKPDRVAFRSPLRNVACAWQQIQQVRVFPDRWGARIHVWSDSASFVFRTAGQVEFAGKARGQMGFAEGEFILQQILERSGLVKTEETAQGRSYARSVNGPRSQNGPRP
jgi:hypothetical protein